MRYLIVFIALTLIISSCGAIPTTDAVTGVTNAHVTFNGHGGSTDCWFSWGTVSGSVGIYKTDNDTTCVGTWFQDGSPLLTSEDYYVRYCDVSGCGNQVTFTTPAVTMVNRTYYGLNFLPMLRNGMNLTQLSRNVFYPYTKSLADSTGTDETAGRGIFIGIIYMMLLIGLWRQQRSVTIALLLTIITIPTIYAFGGVPPEFMMVGQALFIIALGGLILSLFSKR